MLGIKDIFHLAEANELIEEFISDRRPGLSILAGLDTRQVSQDSINQFLPSGRATIFGIMMDEILMADSTAKCIVITEDKPAIRPPRQVKHRVNFSIASSKGAYAEKIRAASRKNPGLLVVDHLGRENASAALEAARGGLRVLTQVDTVFNGANVARQLAEMGVSTALLGALNWVISVQRFPVLCPNCKRPARIAPQILKDLYQRYPQIENFGSPPPAAGTISEISWSFFSQGDGCPLCQGTYRHGDVAAFDVFRVQDPEADLLNLASVLPMPVYMFQLAQSGYLSLEDLTDFETAQFRRTFNLLKAQEQVLSQTSLEYKRKLAELESANIVLEQRTRSLMSLQNISQALITSNDVADLAARICRLTSELCGADRAILYYLGTDDQIVVLATNGWEPDRILKNLVKEQVFLIPGKEIVQFNRWPPGIPPRHPDVEGAELRAGLYVPLFSQDDPVGLMILHSTRKPQFLPGEIALIQTFANQAALAIQRAALIDQLIAKIAELRAAQAAMLEKERIERELEIARQVQLSILPEKFPEAPGYKIGAKYEPARQVGGDFYDVIALDNDYLGLAIGDVSDKGVPAALYMALTRSLLLAEAQRDHSPKAVLANINHLLLALSQENMFVTLFYGILETKTRILTYSCAGHDRPALIRAGRADLLEGEGRPLGILEGEEFFLSEDTVQLVLDDRLVLYTDGLTDVLMQEGRLSDRKRFLSSLELHANRSPTELCQEVFSDLLAAKGDMDQYDDMAMLVLEVNG